jgi:hypothetical protein
MARGSRRSRRQAPPRGSDEGGAFPSSDWVRRGTTREQLGDRALLGLILYYADGTVERFTDLRQWDSTPVDGILLVAAYAAHRYTVGGATREYRALLHSQPYYWRDQDVFGCGQAKDVPDGAVVKTGAAVDDETWRRIYDAAHEDHSWRSR